MSCLTQPLCKVSIGGLELVKDLIKKAHHEFDIVYDVYLANHLPHGLYTILSLGGITSDLICHLSVILPCNTKIIYLCT